MIANEPQRRTVNDSKYTLVKSSNDVESQMHKIIHNIDVKHTNSDAID